jgi:hypothetical protein
LTIGAVLEMIDDRRPERRRAASPFSTWVIWKCTGARSAKAQAGQNRDNSAAPATAAARLYGGPKPMDIRRGKRGKSRRRRRNPVARTLRDPAFRARREASRRRYSRKLKRKQERESEET